MTSKTNKIKRNDIHMIRLVNGTHTKLNQLKYDLKKKTVNDTIDFLIEHHEKTKKRV